jgi:hypothetical protein
MGARAPPDIGAMSMEYGNIKMFNVAPSPPCYFIAPEIGTSLFKKRDMAKKGDGISVT